MPKQPPLKLCLEQLKKQAKDLLKAYKTDIQNVSDRFLEFHPRFSRAGAIDISSTEILLADAQLVIARECGYGSWPEMKRHIESLQGDELDSQKLFEKQDIKTFGRFPTLREMKEYYARDDVLSFLYEECQIRNIDMALRSKRWSISPTSKSDLWRMIEETIEGKIEPGYRPIEGDIDDVRLKECEYLSFHSRTSITSGEKLKGFDIVFESDPPGWRQSFEDLVGVLAILNEFEVCYRIKFSGARSLHFMMPFESFPKQFNGESILGQREEIQKKLRSYFRQYCGMGEAHGGQVLRLAYSLNEDNGLVSLPISPDQLSDFRPWEAIIYNVELDKPWHGDIPEGASRNMLKLLREVYSNDQEIKQRDSRWISYGLEVTWKDRSVYGRSFDEKWMAQLDSSDDAARVEAAWKLMATPEPIPARILNKYLSDKNSDVRWYMTESLQKNLSADVLKLAGRMLRDDDQYTRISAIDALMFLGEDAMDVVLDSISMRAALSMESLNDMTYIMQKLWQGVDLEKVRHFAEPIKKATASLILNYIGSGRDYWRVSGYIQTLRSFYNQYEFLKVSLFHETLRQLFPKLLIDMKSEKADYRLYGVVITDLRKKLTLPLMIIEGIAQSFGMDCDDILLDRSKIEDLGFLESVISDFVSSMSPKYKARMLASFMLYGKQRLIQPSAKVLIEIGASEAVDAMAYIFMQGIHPGRFVSVKGILEGMDSSVRQQFREKIDLTDKAWKLISGQATVAELVEALEDGRRIRRCAAAALTQMGDEAVAELRKTLLSEEKQARLSAMYALGRIGRHNLAAVPVLLEAFLHKNKPTREQAMKSLKHIGQPAIPVLLETLESGVDKIRSNVALVLGRMGDKSAVPGLIRALADESNHVRFNAARALGAIGDPDAVAALAKALNDEKEWGRSAVASSLELIGTPEAIEALEMATS